MSGLVIHVLTGDGAKTCVTYKTTSEAKQFLALNRFGPDVSPDAL